MRISVIVPVYNAGSFIAQAVESALRQPETAEVVLVEDGSPDNSLVVCQGLAAKNDRVLLLRHPDGSNRGAGASRNLGMRRSSCEFIAFLDADDYYLPGRFSEAREVLDANPNCDGVYEAVGLRVENEAGLQRWVGSGRPVKQLTTLTRRVRPEDLWGVLISGGCGYLQLDGLVLRRSILEKSGYMVESMRLHQDTDFIMRVVITSRLLPGRLNEPVAMARVHDHNRISAPRSENRKYSDRMLFWTELYGWCKRRHLGNVQLGVMEEMVVETIRSRRFSSVSRAPLARRAAGTLRLVMWFAKNPMVLAEPQLWQSLRSLSAATQRGAVGR